MSTFDLVLLLIIANAVQNAMVGPDTSLAGGLVAAGVLIGWHRIIEWWRLRSRRAARLLAGEGIMLIHRGHVLEEHLHRGGITRDELQQALREHGVARVDDVLLAAAPPHQGSTHTAVGMETSGEWSIIYRRFFYKRRR